MKIIYFSNLISDYLYKNLYKKEKKPGAQAQVFNNNIVKGLLENNIDIICVSNIPLSKDIIDKTFINVKNDEIFNYTISINIPIIKDLLIITQSFLKTLFLLLNDKKAICVSDILSSTNSLGASFACKILKRQFIGIVTDIPELISNDTIFLKISNIILNNCTDYIFLTEDMNLYLNKNKKPYQIIEGMCKTYEEINIDTRIETFMYAGSIDKVNGIDKLVEAFKNINYNLEIYGDGDYKDTINDISKKYPNIKYKGLLSHNEILKRIQTVKFLVNPRDINNKMVKYSFPSKTMEYLASSTPFITTKLPCIPSEYYQYLNFFDENNIESGIRNILNEDYSILLQKAKKGKKFVLDNKNNKIQTKKILDLVKTK